MPEPEIRTKELKSRDIEVRGQDFSEINAKLLRILATSPTTQQQSGNGGASQPASSNKQ